MPRPSLIKDFLDFARQERKWWLVPLMLILAMIGAVILVAANPIFGPWLYPFF